jgi:hypothetical protein
MKKNEPNYGLTPLMKFYRIEESFAIRDRWSLSDPTVNGKELDSRLFTECRKFKSRGILDLSVERGRNALDFTFGPFDMPVVKRSLGEMIEHFAPPEVQRIPVRIGRTSEYDILNVLAVCNGIDEERSEIRRWQETDGWPEKVGEYLAIGDLVLKEKEVRRFKIFRLENWELPLIVCEAIKKMFDDSNISGATFRELKLA